MRKTRAFLQAQLLHGASGTPLRSKTVSLEEDTMAWSMQVASPLDLQPSIRPSKPFLLLACMLHEPTHGCARRISAGPTHYLQWLSGLPDAPHSHQAGPQAADFGLKGPQKNQEEGGKGKGLGIANGDAREGPSGGRARSHGLPGILSSEVFWAEG
jgi:hypothetical protein